MGNSENRKQAEAKQALEGIRVVEFAVYAAGPLVGKHLAEHGAEVIRVESEKVPDGFRVHYPPFKDDQPGLNRGGTFALFNDQVLGVTLNLKDPKAVELAKRLVAEADIVIENFVPGVMERLGLDYETMKAVQPDIIWLDSCNQGQTGPRAVQRGFGSQLTSMSGFTHLTGYGPDQPPMLLYGPYIDFIAVGFGLAAVLAALDFRRRTGMGQQIDLSQYECGLQFMIPELLDLQANSRVMQPNRNRNSRAAPHGAYPCQGEDSWCAITVFNQEQWAALCQVAKQPQWAEDPRFLDMENRKQNEDALDELIGEWTRQWSAQELMEALQAVGVPSGVVYILEDLYSCPQLEARQQWVPLEHAELGTYEFEAPPFILSETPAQLVRPCPLLGEHNELVFCELLGLSREEMTTLQEQGVIC